MKSFPEPTTKNEVRSFLGITVYYQKFVHNFYLVALLLTDLLPKRNTSHFMLFQKPRIAFKALKTVITTAPVLSSADFVKEFVPQTDALNTGIRAVLTQCNGEEHPITNKSKKLLPVKQCYLTLEFEALELK
ncbi:hypothetical protein QYM36_004099 [Artemia franciscana]|uniref:RNA-directed DNA polymerase n=1 Tax=Artemia franciscana TaxID=6661 RepID=A0AA88L7Q9_ARTSF|nr:hypothetical protein QYM36_004099 [Artemia franciscana]